MKKPLIILTMFFSLLFVTPFLWSKASDLVPFTQVFASSDYNAPESFRLLLTESGEVIELNAADYLTGCLYAQISPGYHIEALKAQAAAAYTYAVRVYLNNKSNPGESSADADISDDSVTCQPYFTKAQAEEYYGAEYDIYYDNIRKAAEYGAGRIITYDGEPVYAVYHSVSAGATNTARYVWGVDFPYLKSVPSDWDREFVNFVCTNEISEDNMRRLLLEFDPDIIMPLDYSRWFSEYAADENGYVAAVSARNLTVSGGDVWRALNLRSAAFKIDYTGGVFVVTTKGHGHGVGLSQFGADFMARKGYSCEEILHYYYTGVTILNCV